MPTGSSLHLFETFLKQLECKTCYILFEWTLFEAGSLRNADQYPLRRFVKTRFAAICQIVFLKQNFHIFFLYRETLLSIALAVSGLCPPIRTHTSCPFRCCNITNFKTVLFSHQSSLFSLYCSVRMTYVQWKVSIKFNKVITFLYCTVLFHSFFLKLDLQ